jgi:hypothetical protein
MYPRYPVKSIPDQFWIPSGPYENILKYYYIQHHLFCELPVFVTRFL